MLDISSLTSKLSGLGEHILEDWLNVRDSEAFDRRWTEASDFIGASVTQHPGSEELFTQLCEACNCHEIVGYIIDDIDLIHTYDLHGASHPMIDHMRKMYNNGVFPILSDQMIEYGTE